MTAFYFGPPDRPLFGFAHTSAGEGDGAVLICPPWGVEYQYAHRALRALADRLARRGRTVLRFDYSGTGDSWGASREADLDRWSDDVAEAARELRTLSGHRRLEVVGLRLGGVTAARFARDDGQVDQLVLWDPVVDGTAWVREVEALGPGDRAGSGAEDDDEEEGELEFGRHVVSRRFLRQVEAVGPESYAGSLAPRVLHLVTEENRPTPLPVGPGGEPELEHRPQPVPWVEDVSIWAGQIPAATLDRITAWLADSP